MENTDKIAPALVKAQKEMKTAVKGSENPFFKSKYADLGAVWEACHEALSDNGIAVIQGGISLGDKFFLRTTLLHTSGQSISGDYLVMAVKQDPQALGSAYTYARRYSLAAMVGVMSEDDDANKASEPAAKTEKKTYSQPSSAGDTMKRVFIPNAVIVKEGTKKDGKPWRSVSIKDEAGDFYSTFDDTLIDLFNDSKQSGRPVEVLFTMNGKYRNITGAVEAKTEEVPF